MDIRDIPAVMQDSIGYGNVFGQVPVLTLIAASIGALQIRILTRSGA